MKTKLLPALGLLALTVVSCNKSGSRQDAACEPKPIALTTAEQNVVAAQNRFAFDYLHQALLHDNKATNKLISPVSIYLALSMVYNGAGQSTRDAIQGALRLHNISIEDLNKTCQNLAEQMPEADCKVAMSIANSLWYRPGYVPLESYVNVMKDAYHASIQPFAHPDAAAAINRWVSDNTHEKIKKLVDQVSDDEILWLINAIYFKGSWMNKFDKRATGNNAFHKADGSTVTTPFMRLEHDSLVYYGNDSLQLLELPYGGGQYAMYVIVPSTQTSLANLTANLPAGSFQQWRSQAHARKVRLFLPRFKYSYSIDDMKPDLDGLGMGIAMTSAANFSNMYTQPVQISRAIHKTFIEVNEDGTEAAAVTGIGMELTSMPQMPVIFADRPFLYVITEKTSGVVLFTGIVHDPSEE